MNRPPSPPSTSRTNDSNHPAAAPEPRVPAGSVRAPSAEAMQTLGARLGRAMQAGDVVGLTGPLGSGKTTFAQGIAVGLEVPSDRHVASPTFALVNQHPGRVRFLHADFYRVKDKAELAELGLEEAYDDAAAALEWAERFLEVLPADHLHIEFVTDADGGRRLALFPTGARGQALAAALLP
ncbi:MAG TPA: tRNA (adenosine(37)-N6)-threonylcarbamoyltransferase complex ATPase subunit type 1 TsaE [Polyangia bacterium]